MSTLSEHCRPDPAILRPMSSGTHTLGQWSLNPHIDPLSDRIRTDRCLKTCPLIRSVHARRAFRSGLLGTAAGPRSLQVAVWQRSDSEAHASAARCPALAPSRGVMLESGRASRTQDGHLILGSGDARPACV
jgi:hypothetical protein